MFVVLVFFYDCFIGILFDVFDCFQVVYDGVGIGCFEYVC